MNDITDIKLYELINKVEGKFFAEGHEPEYRHLRVPSEVMKILGYTGFVLAGRGKPLILSRIQKLHGNFYRDKDISRGPLHVGVYVFRGVVARIEIPLIFGKISFNPYEWSDLTEFQMRWLCNENSHVNSYLSVFCDIMDFGRSIIPMAGVALPAKETRNYISIARSHLISSTTLLSENLGLRGCSQSALLGAEFSLKATMKTLEASDFELKSVGHNLGNAVEYIAERAPEINKTKLLEVTSQVPRYVKDRYSEAAMTKTQCGEVLVKCQFIAGECARFLTGASFQEQLKAQDSSATLL